jgi:hypothetical protein
MAESLYLRNGSNYKRNAETIDIDSKFRINQQCIKNFALVHRKEWDKIGPTKHISHSQKSKQKKGGIEFVKKSNTSLHFVL